MRYLKDSGLLRWDEMRVLVDCFMGEGARESGIRTLCYDIIRR